MFSITNHCSLLTRVCLKQLNGPLVSENLEGQVLNKVSFLTSLKSTNVEAR